MRDPGRDYRLTLLCVWAAAFAAFVPSLSGDFLLDDPAYILANDALLEPRRWHRVLFDPAALTTDPEQAPMMYRPLTALSFALNRFLGGDNPFWFHLVSAALHALNASLLAALAFRLLGSLPVAAGAALLFALHPAQAEAVAYISGSRATILSLLFCLVSALAWPARPRLSAGAFALGLLSKESAFFLLPVLWLLQEGPWRARARRLAPHAAVFAAYLLARRLVLGRVAQRPLWGDGPLEHAVLALRGLLQDASNAFWPFSLRACYSFPDAGPGGAILAAALLAGAALWALRRHDDLGFGAAWFLAGLIPVSNVVPVDALAADRFLYHSLPGLGLLWGAVLRRLPPPRAALGALGLASLALPPLLEQQLAWGNAFTLDLAARAAAPADPCAAVNLASHYLNWGMSRRAEALLAPLLREGTPPHLLRPARLQLALARWRQGRSAEARELLEEGLRRDPGARELEALLAQLKRLEAGRGRPSRAPGSTPR